MSSEQMECPFPCGWQKLYESAVRDAAHLARTLNEGETITEAQRNTVFVMADRLIRLSRANLTRAAQLAKGAEK